MTVTGDEPSPRPARATRPSRGGEPRRSPASLVSDGCPFLLAAEGGWRASQATRDHRCTATEPPVEPALQKQRSVCLAAAHRTCATYRAARAQEPAAGSRPAAAGDPDDAAAGLWPDARTTIVALEPAHARVGGAPSLGGRGGQAVLVGLMVVALVAVVLSRTTGPGPGASAGASPEASAIALATATPAATVVPTASPEPTEAPTAAPTESPTATPKPTKKPKPTPTPIPADAKRYKVKSGDTLSGIASKYGVTVKALKAANNLTTNIIHVGQVLVIP